MRNHPEVINFAERTLVMLDEGSFSSTYKFAVLLGLMDVCIERTSHTGDTPDVITTWQLAERVAALYWRQTSPLDFENNANPLNQNTGTQAAFVSLIFKFQEQYNLSPFSPISKALSTTKHYSNLIRKVEWKLIEMPLPKLQRVAGHDNNFIYSIGWSDDIRKSCVFKANGEYNDFDNRIFLKPGVGNYFVLLNTLLRPLIYRKWCSMIARINHLNDSKLEDHLFGVQRISIKKFATS